MLERVASPGLAPSARDAVAPSLSVRDVIVKCTKPGRRSGAIMLTDKAGRLTGLFTDSDLARLFEQRRDASLDRPIHEVMTPQPITVALGSRVVDAVEILRQRKISELPVIDADSRPAGLIDITDVVGLFPEAALVSSATPEIAKFPAPLAPHPDPRSPRVVTDRDCA